MTVSQTIKAILEANVALAAAMTGGIYDFEETGRMGISVSNTPSAFDGPRLKPTMLVKARNRELTSHIADEAARVRSYAQVIEIYFYQDGGYASIETAMQMVYSLLNEKKPAAGYGPMQLINTIEGQQAEDLGGASLCRMDFNLIALWKPS